MPLIDVVKDVCATVGVIQPTSVFASIASNRTMQEMLTLANEVAQRIAYDTRDWQTLQAVQLFTADGVTEGYALPVNYQRMLLDGNIRTSRAPTIPPIMIGSLDQWLDRRSRGISDPRGEWIIYGDFIHFAPILGNGVTVSYGYLDNRPIKLAAGGYGTRFVADGDSYRLNERLFKLGMIWQWKAQKGSPYAEDMGTFSDALAMAGGHDQPAPIFVDSAPLSQAVRAGVAYPWPVPS